MENSGNPKSPKAPQKPTREQLIDHIASLEGVNKQLTVALRRCLELLANVPPEVADNEKWKSMLDDLNKVAAVGERIATDKTDKIDKPLHDEKEVMPDQDTDQDEFLLTRFVEAQEGVYEEALAEIRLGMKKSHWMWFIFPQIAGLGSSMTAPSSLPPCSRLFFLIFTSFFVAALMGKRLLNCCAALMSLQDKSAAQVFGYPDDLKLRSSITLFSIVAEDSSPFDGVLEKYYSGVHDAKTIDLLR